MSKFRKESEEEKAFKRQMEACESVFDACTNSRLPEGTDYHYFKTFEAFSRPVAEMQHNLQRILLNFPGADKKDGARALKTPEDTHVLVMDMLDQVLDSLDKAVDDGHLEIRNIKLQTEQDVSALSAMAGQVEGNPLPNQRSQERKEIFAANNAAASAQKPHFESMTDIDNSNNAFSGKLEFWRGLKEGKTPVPDNLAPMVDQLEVGESTEPPHPLRAVIESLVYPSHALEAPPPIMYKSLEDTPFQFVDTLEKLQAVAEALAGAKHVAVDLEAHSFRSFQGFTCLMQLSDRKADYIIDVIKLRPHIGSYLGPVFADPQVVKVLHGSNWDVLWLQRDFGIYVVNMFDTGQAARVLKFEKLGYAFLLENFCHVKTDKRYQLADWRVRPIPDEMMKYARIDTHYLLYIHDQLKVLLGEVKAVDSPAEEDKRLDGMSETLERSRQLTLTRYNKPLFSETNFLDALNSYKKSPILSKTQEDVFRELYRWRDQVARERDESLEFVIPKHALLAFAETMPKTVKELKAAAKGGAASMVMAVAEDILQVIAESVRKSEQEANGQELAQQDADSTMSENAAKPSNMPGLQLHTGLRPKAVPQPVVASPNLLPTMSAATATTSPAQPLEEAVPGSLMSKLPQSQLDSEPALHASTNLLKPKLLNNVLPLVAPKVQSQQSDGKARGTPLFSNRIPAIQPILPPTLKGTSSLFGAAPKDKSQQDRLAMDKFVALKAGMILALPSMQSIPAQTHTAGVEGVPDDSEPAPVCGHHVREVADALRAESEAGDPSAEPQPKRQKTLQAPESVFGDFLPLPISKRYPKYQKRSQSEPEEAAAGGSRRGDVREQAEGISEEEGEVEASESGDAAVNAILRATGLQSDSDDHEQASRKPAKSVPSRKRRKKASALEVVEDRRPDVSIRADPMETSELELQTGGDSNKQGQAAGEQSRFDYSAAQASTPGLQLNFEPVPSRGRGGRGRGRRGGRNRGPATQARESNAASMYALDDSKFIKGGKRSAVMPRSGNRNLTFSK